MERGLKVRLLAAHTPFGKVMYAELRTERLLLRPLGGRQIGAVSVALDETRTEGELGWIFDRRW